MPPRQAESGYLTPGTQQRRPTHNANGGFLHSLSHVFTLQSTAPYAVAGAGAAYALLEGSEAVGLWLHKRWAEYLTFVGTIEQLTRAPR